MMNAAPFRPHGPASAAVAAPGEPHRDAARRAQRPLWPGGRVAGADQASGEAPLLVRGQLLCRRHEHGRRLALPPMLPVHLSGFGWWYQCSAPQCDHTRPVLATDHTVWRLVVKTGLAEDASGLTIADKRHALAAVTAFWVGAA